ncbi:non-canonical purine NTP pyrophosphatase [Candidatus Peribacteria bacterium]|nr:non-canonical purine NTP pyrophosphatase [Candidatus Peribacteria bacterium]
MQLLLGTNNRGKVIEMTEVLSGLPIELLTLLQLKLRPEVEEAGTTFRENALIKAQHFFRLSGLPTLADDSGIIVDALHEELGVFTRRWGAGPTASDEEWIEFFLKRMKGEKNKKARFVCCLAYCDKEGTEHVFEGFCDGTITETLEASYLPGLPISACFKPDGCSFVYSAMTIEEKNKTSHRGKAMKKVRDFLEDAQKINHGSRTAI